MFTGDKLSLDAVVAKVKAADKRDKHGENILAAATTLRDSSSRDRKEALGKTANASGVKKYEGRRQV